MTVDTGIGLLLSDGDLVLAGGELATVSGIPALVQDLSLRVLTPLGSDPYNTGYGLDAGTIFGTAGGARDTAELLRLNLVRTIGTDRRVREVHDVTITSADHRTWTATVELSTLDGATAVVPITTGG